MITLNFTDASLSPNGKHKMRVSWKLLDDGSLALVYQHSRRLTKERYDAFVMDGAWITADKRQERAIVESVLSINESVTSVD